MPHLEPTYLRYIYDGLVKGSIHPENAAELPEGLIGLYEEVFDERTSVVKRQKLLQRFAIWALLKKEVSAAFVAEVLGEAEEEILEFISTYSAWFNSPESGKYQLYHERLKVYLLQKLSEEEIHILHEQLIAQLEQAIAAQKADEFEWYGLEFLGNHYFISGKLSGKDNRLFKFTKDRKIWERQYMLMRGYKWTHNMLANAIDLNYSRIHFTNSTENIVVNELMLELADLQGEVSSKQINDFTKFIHFIEEGDVDLVIKGISYWYEAILANYDQRSIKYSTGELLVILHIYLIFRIDKSTILENDKKKFFIQKLISNFVDIAPSNDKSYELFDEYFFYHFPGAFFAVAFQICDKYNCDLKPLLSKVDKEFTINIGEYDGVVFSDFESYKISTNNKNLGLMPRSEFQRKLKDAIIFKENHHESWYRHEELEYLFIECIERGYGNNDLKSLQLIFDQYQFKSWVICTMRQILQFDNSNAFKYRFSALEKMISLTRFENLEAGIFISNILSCIKFIYKKYQHVNVGISLVRSFYVYGYGSGAIGSIKGSHGGFIQEILANHFKFFATSENYLRGYEVLRSYKMMQWDYSYDLSFELYEHCYKKFIDVLIQNGFEKEAVEIWSKEIKASSASWLSPSEDILDDYFNIICQSSEVSEFKTIESYLDNYADADYEFIKVTFRRLLEIDAWEERQQIREDGEVFDWVDIFTALLSDIENEEILIENDELSTPKTLKYFFRIIERILVLVPDFDREKAVDIIESQLELEENSYNQRHERKHVHDEYGLFLIGQNKWTEVLPLLESCKAIYYSVFYSLPQTCSSLLKHNAFRPKFQDWVSAHGNEEQEKLEHFKQDLKKTPIIPPINKCHALIDKVGVQQAINEITGIQSEEERKEWVRSIEEKLNFENFTDSEFVSLIPLFSKYGISSDRTLQIVMARRFISENGDMDDAFIDKYQLKWLKEAFEQTTFKELNSYERFIDCINLIQQDQIIAVGKKLNWIDDDIFKLTTYGFLLRFGHDYVNELELELGYIHFNEEEDKFVQEAYKCVVLYYKEQASVIQTLDALVGKILKFREDNYFVDEEFPDVILSKDEESSFAIYYVALTYYFIHEDELAQDLFAKTWDMSTTLEKSEDAYRWCESILDIWEMTMGKTTLRKHFSKKAIAQLPEWLIDMVLDRFK